jgi:hypothetical protein
MSNIFSSIEVSQEVKDMVDKEFKKLEKPEDLRNIWVTYEKVFSRGLYGDTKVKEIVTKRGFYIELFDHIAVPPDWQIFNGKLLPHGWGGDRLQLNEIIKWEYEDEG